MAVYPLGGREGRLMLLHSSLLLSSPMVLVMSTEVMRSEVSLSNRTYIKCGIMLEVVSKFKYRIIYQEVCFDELA